MYKTFAISVQNQLTKIGKSLYWKEDKYIILYNNLINIYKGIFIQMLQQFTDYIDYTQIDDIIKEQYTIQQLNEIYQQYIQSKGVVSDEMKTLFQTMLDTQYMQKEFVAGFLKYITQTDDIMMYKKFIDAIITSDALSKIQK